MEAKHLIGGSANLAGGFGFDGSLLPGRKVNGESAPASHLTRDFDVAAVQFHKLAHDREAEPGPALAGGANAVPLGEFFK